MATVHPSGNLQHPGLPSRDTLGNLYPIPRWNVNLQSLATYALLANILARVIFSTCHKYIL